MAEELTDPPEPFTRFGELVFLSAISSARDGAMIIDRLGDRGRHARTAIGCATLPNDNAVTLEAIARVAP